MTGTQNLGEPGGATPTISIIRRIIDVKRKKRVNSGTQYALSPADSDRRTLSDEQQDFFRDTKAVTRDGRVMPL